MRCSARKPVGVGQRWRRRDRDRRSQPAATHSASTRGAAIGFVVGTPGNEYRLRIRNLTGARILAVTSVDGVNVVSGETASPAQSGYVLGAWETLDIDGWRTSLQKTAAFYFTDHSNSYAERTGRPNDVGVIGVAVFRERPRVMEYPVPKVSRSDAVNAPAAAGSMDRKRQSADASSEQQNAAEPSVAQERDEARAIARHRLRPRRNVLRAARGVRARDDRAGGSAAVRYDSRANLLAMGVLPRPRMIGRAPDPFPGSVRRAAPD